MKRLKQIGLIMMTSVMLLTLTACGLKLDNDTLSKDNVVYVSGKNIWQFKKNGDLNWYSNKNGKSVLGNTSHLTYKVVAADKGYNLKVTQHYEIKDKDYLVKFAITTNLYVAKEGQSNREFKAKVTGVKVDEAEVNSSIPECKAQLEKQYNKDALKKIAEKSIGQTYQFKQEKAQYLKDKQK